MVNSAQHIMRDGISDELGSAAGNAFDISDFIDAVDIGLALFDNDLNLLEANDIYYRLCGYSRDEANRRLAENKGMIASFSRALSEGLSAQQSDDEFNATLDASIQSIFDASNT